MWSPLRMVAPWSSVLPITLPPPRSATRSTAWPARPARVVEVEKPDARLDDGVRALLVDLEHAIHVAQAPRSPSRSTRGAGPAIAVVAALAVRPQRHLVLVRATRQDRLDLLDRGRHHDGRRGVVVPGRVRERIAEFERVPPRRSAPRRLQRAATNPSRAAEAPFATAPGGSIVLTAASRGPAVRSRGSWHACDECDPAATLGAGSGRLGSDPAWRGLTPDVDGLLSVVERPPENSFVGSIQSVGTSQQDGDLELRVELLDRDVLQEIQRERSVRACGSPRPDPVRRTTFASASP